MAGKYIFSSTDQFELETDTSYGSGKREGCFVSRGKAVSICAVFCIILAGAVLITYFVPKCEVTDGDLPTTMPDPMPIPEELEDEKRDPFEGRLPDSLVPSLYKVKIQPFLDDEDGPKKFSFDGSVEIIFSAVKATSVITLHAHPTVQIDSSFVSVKTAGSSPQMVAIDRTERDDEYEFFKIFLSENGLSQGQEYSVKIDSFTGTLHHSDFQGLYLSNYTEGEDMELRHLVATQFETTNTRRAFPCFDEPHLKAHFDVSIKHRSSRLALCNMPKDSTTMEEDDWVTTTFHRTAVVMPTYLIAIVVADFYSVELTTPNNVQFRVWSRKEAVHALNYSLHTGSEMLTFFEEYWDIKYPLPKQDMVAIPDFYFGAMENWGLVLYRETALLYDPDVNTQYRKHRVAALIAHELAHMWFGNLVTLAWWDHVWLNEAFASYYEYPALEEVEPSWDSMNQFHPRDDLYRALDFDDSWSSHPTVRPVGWPDDIWSQFDAIAYQRGSCLNLMMKTFLGKDTFKTGLQNYLNKYQYSNTESDDLFAELTEADRGKKDTDVKKIMDTWTLQMGYPIVTLSRDGNTIMADQERFIMDPDEEQNDKHYDMGYKWYIPLTYTDQSEMSLDKPSEEWMNRESVEFTLSETAADDHWYLVNIDYLGFYRVKYENDNWDKLAKHLKDEEHTTIPVRTRAQLLEDAFSIANAHQMDQVYSIKLLEYLSKETDHVPWYTAINRISYTRDMLKRTAAYGFLEKHMRSLINGMYYDKRWDFNHDDHLTYYKQIDAINTACYYGHQDCIDYSVTLFNRWLDRPETSQINEDVKNTVFCTAIKNTGGSVWEAAFNLYDNSTLASGDRNRLQAALACSNEQWTVGRYMEYALDKKETKIVIENVLKNSPIGYTLAWEFTTNRWEDIHKEHGDEAYEIVWMFADYMNTEADLMKLEAFGKQYHDMPGSAARMYYMAVDKVKTNINWMTRNYDQVYNQLITATKDPDEPAEDREPFDGYLPDALKPSLYTVTIKPYLDEEDGEKRFRFDGDVAITFTAEKETKVIVLHAHKTLMIDADTITVTHKNSPLQAIPISSTDRVEKYEFYQIHLSGSGLRQKEEYVVTIGSFTGTLHHPDFLGFYLSNYTEGDNQQRNLAATQFAPTAARKAFPCFDEPTMKAKFAMTIVHRNSRVALCNMPVKKSTSDGDWDTTEFETTSVDMSTYLVAMVIADFGSLEMTTPHGTLMRVWSRKDVVPALNYSLHSGSDTLTFFEDYFDIDYKLPKQDMVAIPNFYFGAMENWGLILYRETALLYDPEVDTPYRKYTVASIVAHELAHMWFGNLVTMAWWSHVWLNEGFASYLEFPALEAVEPTWDAFDQLHQRYDVYRALDYDDSWSSHPQINPIGWPDEIMDNFDTIAYPRGCALNRMMQTFLGESTFRTGLQNYLNKYQFSNTLSKQLFDELTEADKGYKDTNVAMVMDTWTIQMGYPIITLTRSADKVHAEQKRFIMDPNEEPNDKYDDLGYKWFVPLTHTDQVEMNFTYPHELWMDVGPADFTLSSPVSDDDWYLVNIDQNGFFRVKYEDKNWDKVAKFLKEDDHASIPIRTRAQLLDDAFSIAHAHQMDQVYSIKLLEYLSKETDYLPWYTAILRHGYTRDMLKRTAAYGYLESHMRVLVNNNYWAKYWNFKHDEQLAYYRQIDAIQTACYYGHQDCVSQARTQFEKWLDNPKDTTSIHVNVRDSVFCTAIKHSSESVWEKAWSLYDNGDVPSGERSRLRSALACSKEPWIIERYMDYALSKNEANSVIGSVLNNSPVGYSLALDFTMNNWNALKDSHGSSAYGLVWQFANYMNSETDLMKLEEFARKNQYAPDFPEKTYQSTVDKVKLNIQWRERNYEAVYQQLMDATSKTEEPADEREPFDGRLPETLKPSLYSVTIKPYLDEEDGEKRFTFDGSVEIIFEVLNSTDVIVLHAHGTLKVDDSDSMITVAEKDNPSQTIDVDRVEIVEKYEFVKVHLASNLVMGSEYMIKMDSFTGTLHHSDFQGLYLSNYTEGGETKHLVATQFETTNTRRAFPSFDEPALKAKFSVTIVHRQSRVALCNMPEHHSSLDGDWKTTVFEETAVLMPTYLIAIVVAEFESVEMETANGVLMRVWSRPEAVHALNYSMHTGSEMLTFFEDYWNIPYPLPKEDMVAIPDFYFGAMENWGLVLYRETALLYDPDVNTHFRKHSVAAIIAHELAHMWFGNLVTLEWWDHVWLNEGYASFYEYPALEKVEPTWDAFDQFHPRDDLYRALDFDDSWSSHPTVRPVGWPDDIWSQFDRIAYQRGSCMNMMMETFLGNETFKTGLYNYLMKYQYSNAVSDQLFAELTKADEGKKNTDVKKVMDTWLLQMGYPIVTVTRDRNDIHADQERFIMDPNETPNNNYYDMGYKWYVHLTYTDQKEMEFENPSEKWMEMGSATFQLQSSLSDDDWYLVNIDHRGFYRVKYENENWDKLAKYLKEEDHTTIPVRTRSQLIEEAFSIAHAHQMDQVYSIKLLEYLSKETEHLPWYTAILRHGYTRDMLKRTAAYGYLEEHFRSLINSIYWEKRWDFSHDDHLSYYKQIDALTTACYYGHQDCVDSAKMQFSQWLDNPEDTSLIHVNIKSTVYCTAIKYGIEDVWERTWSLYDSGDIPSSERSAIRSALACTEKQWLIRRYLEYALAKNQANSVIGDVLRNSPYGYSLALEFTTANWDALREAHGSSAFSIVWQFADFMNTYEDLMKLEMFGSRYQYAPGFPESTYQSTVDKVKLNIQWVERNYEAVYQQLMDATNKTEEPPEREPFDGRLPETLKPSLYSISIKPYLDEEDGEKRFSFDGSVEMTFEVLDATDVIIFHAHDTLKVDDTLAMITVAEKDNPSQTIGVDRVEIVEKYEFVKVYLVSDMQMGKEYVLTLNEFTGTLLHSDLLGLYLSNYTEGENNDVKRAIATQFESTFARRAFPCFDEPQLKAKFEMTIEHRNSRIALWNMPVMETTQDGDWNTTVFERTNIVMPTYLIAIVVGDFGSLEITTANNKTMRVWSRKEEVSNLNYSLHVGSEILTYFEDYFEILDPLPKHDMVAVPDFGSGAMENWGLILYRESYLLYDPGYNSQFRKHGVAAVIAHELAHMWFGNLVTLAWWDHLWLNEAFASFLESPPLEVIEPTWQMFDQFHPRDDLYRALDHDDSWTSKPTVRPVGWPDEIDDMFDRVAYQRGSALVMMMRTFLGEETFKAGLQSYLNKYAYSNAVSHQLFAELTKADEGKKDTNVTQVMDTWTLQMGYPIVTVTRDGNVIHADQERFLMDPNETPNNNYYDMGYKWYVPLTYTDQREMSFDSPHETWMDMGPADFTLTTTNDSDWYLVNIDHKGLYRVKYENENWDKLAKFLKEDDYTSIPIRTRSQLIEESFSIANAHQMDQVYSIKIMEYLSKETEYLPWYTAVLRHGYTRDMLKRTAAYGYLEEHMRWLINNQYWQQRWDFSHDDHLSYYKQINALETACYYGHQDCVDNAKAQFSQWLDNPEDTNLIHFNIKDTVYCTAIKYGTEEVWEKTWSLYDSGNIPSGERSSIRSALACSKEQWIIKRYLDYALTKKEANSVIGSVLRNSPIGYSMAVEFTMANWDALRAAHGNGAFSVALQFGDFMNTPADLMKLEEFGRKNMYVPGFPENTYQSTVDKVKLNIQWVERNYEAVYQQLMDATNKTEEPPEREPFDGRLPETLKPSLYSISIKPYLDEEDGEKRFSFDGSVEMTFEVLDTTDIIIFHAHDTLKVDDTPAMITVAEKDNPSQTIDVDRVEIVEKYEFVKVYLVSDMQVGTEYVITLNEFTGTLLHSDLLGLYLSNYTEGENNDMKHAIATQFESTFARRAFPCFDEPQLKAKFEMTIEHRSSRIALWNMPVMETTQDGDWNTTVFERTDIFMPTYLIAIVVADFGSLEMTTANNKTMRVWCRKEEVSSLNYSLHAGSEILTYFEDYFGILDPLPKHDMVAVPDFGSGAMENWGLILYRESYLLYNPEYHTHFRKHGVGFVIAHELAHMWFGNLVTLAWWDHLWLNEAFASYLESPALDAVEPTWQMSDQFHALEDLYRAFDHDDSWTSKPTVRPVGWPDEIDDMFDRVAYQRGAALVMMMKTFLGEETFKAGLQSYLNEYAYSNAVSHQLFAELTKADEGKKDTNVTQVMDTWTLQMGYPIVTVTRDGNVIHADQERFLMDPNETPNNNYYDMGYKWHIPITFTDQKEMEFENPHEMWMNMGPGNFTLSSSASDKDWYLVNINHKGLYRVKYENENWDKLAKFLKDQDHTTIPVRTRSQLVEESFSIANAHQMDQVYSIKMMEYLSKETEYLPWYTAVLRHGYTRDMLKRTAAYGYLEEHMRWLINNQYWEQRWDFSHDDHLSYYKQINALKTACFYGHQDCVDNAKAQFTQWLDNPEDTKLINVDITDTVYCTAIKYGTDDVWERVWSLYDSENIPSSERSSIQSALACSKEQWIAKRYLEYALLKKETNTVIGAVLGSSPVGYSIALEFTMANWDALRQVHGNSAFNIVWQFADFMNTRADLMKLEEFGRKNMYVPGFPESTYQSTMDKVKLNIQWVERNYEAVYQQLMDATNKTEEPPEREPFDGRLPETLKPSLYSISIKPYLDEEDGEKRFSFDGSVEMTFEVLDATDVIIFHAHDTLKVDDTPAMITVAEKDNPSQTIGVDRVEIVEKYEFVKVYLVSDLQMGTEYVITLSAFTGTLLHSDLLGLYLSNYTEGENNDMKRAIATQFESTFARRAFPCFDEPQLKAKFEMTIKHRNSRIALWNMPVMETTQDGDWNTTVFERTNIVMPTYLIAIVVADFGSLEMTTANNKTMRVWCRKEEVSNLNYSLHVGSELLTYFEDYFEILDPLPKHDMVAVPDFGSGAMENWGLILYRESLLLYDPGYNSQFRKHSVAAVIAHELAHMWFGNLVTLAWWDHLWLNEAFASFLETPSLEVVEPTWQMFDQFHARDDLYRALDHDDSWTSKPTVRPVGWPDEIDGMFDRVAYQRGSALVMMMRTFLGEETFKAGLQTYLNKYAYSNAVSHQLFAELTKADEGKKDTNVTQVMDTWTLQMGYPIVTVTRDGNVIHADQERFLMDPNETPNNNYYDMGYKWYVPLTYTDQREMSFDSPHETWMNMGPADFTLTTTNDSDWYLVNIDHKGLYRVKYENENWDKLAKFLKEGDHTSIPIRTRSQLIEESFSIANAHQMDQVYSIKMMEYLSKETEYLPWYTAVLRHGYTRDMLKRTAAYGYLEEHMRWLINNQYWQQRWDFSHDDHLSYYKQINAQETACYYGHQDCVDNAKAQFSQWLDNVEDTNLIHFNIKDTVYCSAIKYGTEDVWERVLTLYDSGKIPSGERSSIRSALACSDKQWILKRYMDYALGNGIANSVIGSVLRNSPIGYSMAFDFTMANWDSLREVHGSSAFSIVWQFADFMNTDGDLMKLELFGKKNMYVPGFPENTYQSTVDKVKLNIQWMKRNYEAVYQQLMDATSKTEEPADEKEPFDGRLPDTLAPSLYTISVKPYLDEEDGGKRFTFDGSVEIVFEVLNSTDVIVLHAHDTLKVNDSDSMITVALKGDPSQTIGVDRVEIVEKYEFVKIYLSSELEAGLEYIVTMDSFTGTLHHADFQGLYLSNYTENEETKHMVATQFEIASARRAFPCFDEPALKAYFDVTIIHKNTRIALCNMPVKETTTNGDWNTTVFDITSVVMPTYLVAMVVADFRSMEMQTANGKIMRVWSRPEAVSSLNYSMHVGSDMLDFLEDYWGIEYPLPKEDMVAIPDFYFGAMENWGLILYRETGLMYDPDVNDQYRKHSVANVIGHELAHMWFGNLVTLEWWDHVWLNEGYATFYTLHALDAVEPTWDVYNHKHQRDNLYRAFDFDDSWSSHPTVRPVGWTADIWGQFDRIGYQRGACMSMMMESFLGMDTYKTGITNYLYKYQYSNAATDDLLDELTMADEGKKDTDVKKVMDTWLLQMGYPVVTLSRDGNTIHAEQTRFIMDPNEEPNDEHYDMGYLWYVPVTYTDQSSMNFTDPMETWMDRGPADFNIPTSNDDDWYLVNINQNGFYRVKYEDANWNKLATYLKEKDHKTIPVRTRSQLLEDAFSIANAHQMDQVYSIKLLEYLSKETEYTPWYTVILRHGYTRDMLKRTAAYGYFEEHLRSLIGSIYWEQQWDFNHDDHLTYYKQIEAINTACYYGHQHCVDSAQSQFNQWLDNPEETSSIHINVRQTVYCTAIRHSTDSVWEKAWSLYDSGKVPSGERGRIRSALACSDKQWIIKRYLDYALTKKEANSVIGSVLRNSPIGYSMAVEFTMANWDALRAAHGTSAFNIVWQFADFMNTAADLMKLEEFGRKSQYVPGFPEKTYQSTVDKVKLNIQWMERNYEAVYQQLMDATSKTEEPADEREPFDGRLPETLAPSLYTISVTPYLDEEDGEKRFTFDGSVEIIFEVLNSTDVIVLHAHGTLKVDDSDSMITVAEKDNPSQTIGVDRVEIVEKYEFVMVHLTSNLVMGSEYIIKMDSFTGTLHHADFQGLYLSNYTEGGETKHMVATQLETTNARRVFPCFDEPALKATFDVTIVHKNTRIALCNMPVKETTTDGDWNTTVFDTTSVVMPTYLIAIVVADFRSMEIQTANNKTMRVWSRPEALSALNYSMHTGSEMLTFFEDYWEIGYPLPKQDMVAIPDFYFGAMENWGLVLYRETALLYDPQVNDQYRKHRVAAIIAHELAHMWFGNLVTLDWWDHVWLNEGYASFFELPVLEAVEPSWDVFNQFFQRDDLYRAMDFDDSWSSHPTVRPVGWPDDIWSQFDRIAYQRGSCMNMMMRTFLGEDTFKEGLKSYLNEYQYSNAVSDQLFAELTKADVGKKNTDVKKVMDTWLLQMGYPVVTLSRDGNTIHAEQTRFIMDPNEEPNDKHYDMGYKWHIPLTFTDESEKEYSNPTEAWMEVGPADFNIPTSSGDDWYLVNINQNGFYRVKYEDANWNKLATYLKENDHTTIPVRTRAQLLDDAFSIANAHQMDQVYSIKLLEYLSKETDYLPLYTAILRHGYTRDMLKRTAAYGYLERHMRYLLNNSYWELEWDFSHDSHLGYYKQIDSLRTACYYGHSDCIMRAKMQFNQWMDNINDTSAIESNLKDTVYCAAMKYGSEDIWERAWSLYDSENIPSDERSRVRSALACSKEQWILERYMEYALLKKEASSVIGNVLRNSGHTVAWDFTMNNWNELKEIHGNGALSIVWQFADYMNTDSDLTKLQAFGNKYMDMPGFSTSSYQNAVDKVKLNIDWMKRNYQPVYQQLKDATRNYVL